ncbi:MAG: DUF4149 domain-containing protein [Kiloniellales bacterium]|nr:DUF4149 domain-containing protein [Kiloniellales bacterium]
MNSFLTVLGQVSTATLFGSMAFFSCVMAPLVFIKLEEATAGRFIRSVFPWYYLVVLVLSLVAALALAFALPLYAAAMAAIAAGAVVCRQMLMPRINRHRDAMLAGDSGAGKSFDRLHKLSVWINGAQLLAALAILVLLAAR